MDSGVSTQRRRPKGSVAGRNPIGTVLEVQAVSALSGELLFQGSVSDHEQLLRKLERLPHSSGFRLLLGAREVVCDAEFAEAVGRNEERPVVVHVLRDAELERRICAKEDDGFGNWVSPDWWNDRTFAYRVVKTSPQLAPIACASLGRADRAFLLYAVKVNPLALRFVGAQSSGFYLEAVAANPQVYPLISDHIRFGREKKQLASSALRDADTWRFLPDDYDAVAGYLDILETQPAPRRAPFEVWHTRHPRSLLVHMQKKSSVIGCRALVSRAVARCWHDLKYALFNVRNDRDVVLAAVEGHWRALQYASWPLRNDRGLVLTAVQQNGLALCFASAELRADEDLALRAVRQQRRALQYVAPSLLAKWRLRDTEKGAAATCENAALSSDRDLEGGWTPEAEGAWSLQW